MAQSDPTRRPAAAARLKVKVPTRISPGWVARTAMAERADEQALEALLAAMKERGWDTAMATENVVRAVWKEARAFHAQVASETKARKSGTKKAVNA